jgi:hypothetical protein
MWDHLTPAMLANAATVPVSTSHRRDTDAPKLHAFPAGSDVSLCGKRKSPGEGVGAAASFCRACEGLASSVNHRG